MKKSQCKFLCLLTLISISGFAYSQFDYRLELEKRLYPKFDTATTKEVVLFISKPSFVDSECSIRIIITGNQSFIEARILDKNLWEEQFKQNKQADTLSVETYCYSAPVSHSFRDKMLAAFTKVIELNEKRIKPNGIQLYDGICYEFMVDNKGNKLFAKIDYNLEYDDFRDKVASTNLRIIDALRRHFFNESVYKVYNEP